MAKAIIFDLGKVVFDYSFSLAYAKWAKSAKLTEEIVRSKFSFDSYFEDYESGKISTHDFYTSVNDKLSSEITIEDFQEGWNSIFLEEVEGIRNLLKSLKKKYRLVALTNTNELHKPVWLGKFQNTISIFEKIFCSFEIRSRKPETKAFQAPIKYLGYPPNQIFFLDDLLKNVEGAKNVGLNTILVESFDQMRLSLIRNNLHETSW